MNRLQEQNFYHINTLYTSKESCLSTHLRFLNKLTHNLPGKLKFSSSPSNVRVITSREAAHKTKKCIQNFHWKNLMEKSNVRDAAIAWRVTEMIQATSGPRKMQSTRSINMPHIYLSKYGHALGLCDIWHEVGGGLFTPRFWYGFWNVTDVLVSI
jgi:hypothetical protein